MIELSRKQIQTIRSTLRHAFGRRIPAITFQTVSDALLIRATNDVVAIERRIAGNYEPTCFAIPAEALAMSEARQDGIVQFEQNAELITLRWIDAAIPQSAQFPLSEPTAMPEPPSTRTVIDRQFLDAMADACETTESESTRYALNCVQLRGTSGKIAATDGQQALIQSGHKFPWAEDFLIHASPIFTSKAIRGSRDVSIGKSTDWMFVTTADWTVACKIEKDRRFPAIDTLVPELSAGATTMILAEDDAEFLALAINRLPGSGDNHSPVTLDLNGAVVVRAKSKEQQSPTDLVLRNSQRRGAELKISSNRTYIQRAIRLGFRELYFRDVDAPAFCRTERHAYLWMLLGREAVLKPDATAIRIESPASAKTTVPAGRPEASATQGITLASPPSRKSTATTHSRPEAAKPARMEHHRSDSNILSALIEDGVSLRATLRDVLAKTNALVVGLKRQRQQSNLMRSAVKSLRAAQAIES